MGKNIIVEVQDLCHRYSTKLAIKDINLSVPKTGVLGFLGSNGAGKSTTMNIICGVINQSSGKVFINGIDTTVNPIEARKNIGFLPQDPPLYLDLTVEEYLTYAANLRLLSEADVKQAVQKVMEKCSITHFATRLLKNLSGGYRQRVGIAQAIIHNPKLVILDEPTNGLDPNQIHDIRSLIRSIAKEHAVLLSTHILAEARAICDNISMIENGQLVFSGSMEAFDNYIEPTSFLVSFDKTKPLVDELRTVGSIGEIESINEYEYRCYFASDRDITSKIISHSIANKWMLNKLIVEKCTIEEVFAQLSKKQ